jgi:alpha-methylacyl-CoA racemase
MGPLTGIRVLEIASLTPGKFACMLLGDLGAEVLRVDRPAAVTEGRGPAEPLSRGRRSVMVDLKSDSGQATVLRLAGQADVLIEGFRPGVAERLGIGPQPCHERNPALVYGRMTGWGQDGPMAHEAGHDINYIAIAGALHPIGNAAGPPVPPGNFVGDFGGGGLLLAYGVVAALFERERSGLGQVIDAAMGDGAALMTTGLHGMRAAGRWSGERGTNLADGGAPFYGVYRTLDDNYVAVGAYEPRFYAALIAGLGLAAETLPEQHDKSGWPGLRRRFAAIFAQKTQRDWTDDVFAGRDACVTPVLSPGEVASHPASGLGEPSSSWTAWPSLRRHPGSRARAPEFPSPRRCPGRTPTPHCAAGGSRSPRSKR